jgi:energy-coupling factor transporter ATP-binding protein EcfA2
MTRITLFPKLTDTKTHQFINLDQVLDGIKKGAKLKPTIDKIRGVASKEERDELKKGLPLVTFGGMFTERRASALKEYSRLICLDFDDLGVDIENMRDHLKEDAHVMAVWKSPAGNGLKCLIKVASDNHLGHALALLKEFPEADANAIKDINRACFLSYDPDLYYNPKADIYTKFVESAHTDQQKYEKLIRWLEGKGEKFAQGNRNNFIAKLAGAMNRFGISEDFAKQVIERDYVKDDGFTLREAYSVIRSMYTNYVDQFNTASFDDAMSDKEVSDILSSEIEAKDIITVYDVMEDLERAFEHGVRGGKTTYFPVLDNHFRFMKGELTTLTGIAGAGKSTILNQLLTFNAAFDKEKSLFLSMESYPPVFFYREFIRTIIGKPVEFDNPHKMTKSEYSKGLEWVNEYFYFLYPTKDDATPDWTLGRFAEAVVKHGITTVVIDPMNSMSHDYKANGGRDDRYIANMLSKYQRFALQNNVNFFLVAHPRGIGKKDDGTYKEPTPDEISGGPTYWQRCDNVLSFHRPSLPLDFTDPTCTLRSWKIKKQQLNGIPGVSSFTYDKRVGRYFENSFNPLETFKL